MKVLVVYYHPEQNSFNHAMLEEIRASLRKHFIHHKVTDLHAGNFDPVPGRNAYRSVKDPFIFKQQIEELHASQNHTFAPHIENEIRKIQWCDLMIWQFPLWWCSLPAVFKGYVDRVFAMGRAYQSSCFFREGLFKGKRAMLSLTTGGPESMYLPGGEQGDIHELLRPVTCGILEFTGFTVLEPFIVHAPAHMNESERKNALQKLKDRIELLCCDLPVCQEKYFLCRQEQN